MSPIWYRAAMSMCLATVLAQGMLPSLARASGAAEICADFLEQPDDPKRREACLEALDAAPQAAAGAAAAQSQSMLSSADVRILRILEVDPAGEAPPIRPNQNVSRMCATQNESAIAMDPRNAKNLFVLSHATENRFQLGMMAAFSNDGGGTWIHADDETDPPFPDGVIADGQGSLPRANYDPSASWDELGNLFIAHATDPIPGQQNQKISLSISTNGGQDFTHVALLGDSSDYPTVATGPPSEPGADGSVWLSYQSNDALIAHGAPVYESGAPAARVGAFGPPVILPESSSSGSRCAFGEIALGPDGQVLVACQGRRVNEGGPHEIYAYLDPDGLGAAPFGSPVIVGTININRAGERIPAQQESDVGSEVGLAWDRSGGPYSGRVHLVYTDEIPNGSKDFDIFVRHSDDDGLTWSSPVQVNDDDTTMSQFLPAIAVDQTTGHVAVSWHDARNHPPADGNINNRKTQLFAALSVDGGESFSANVLASGTEAFDVQTMSWVASGGVSDDDLAELPPGTPGYSDLGYGDYTDLAFAGYAFYPVWADNSNSTGDNPDHAGQCGSPQIDGMEIYTVPEPSQFAMTGSGALLLLALAGRARRRSR